MASNRVRPATDPSGTCDWGGCDREAVKWRYDPMFGWLPVCAPCARPVQEPTGRRLTPCFHPLNARP